ncbi:para-aminobenzoate synthase, (PABA) [Coemansia asiatica]|uniref:Para-aminobenzoate synthase, (PABA) n=1 Tax=Coemansia asiatica TaxID=1052880 RepID=A0A9W7XIQ5_9FUNG|nr:para-aminobenzoate synthase, (PABA) [Coemansia asiatica]
MDATKAMSILSKACPYLARTGLSALEGMAARGVSTSAVDQARCNVCPGHTGQSALLAKASECPVVGPSIRAKDAAAAASMAIPSACPYASCNKTAAAPSESVSAGVSASAVSSPFRSAAAAAAANANANANANNNNSTNNNDNNNANSRSQIHPKNNNISIMASGATKGSVTVRYNLQTRTISVLKFSPNGSHDDLVVATEKLPPGDQQSFWTWMQRVVDCTQGAVGNAEQVNGDDGDLEFIGGWIGYFAYEMAAECLESSGGPGIFNETDAPDAQLTFVDRCVVIDHRVYPPCAHVVALVDSGHGHGLDKQQQQQQQTKKDRCSYDSPEWSADLGFSDSAQANAWVAETTHLINQWLLLASANSSETNSNSSILSNQQQQQPKQLERSVDAVDVEFAPWQSRAEYLDSISEAKDLITQGESYEVCLTNQFRVHLPSDRQVRCAKDMLRLYFSMRMTNPAPYGAVLWYDDLKYGIASCSPERFLKVAPESQANANVDSDFECRRVEMKPIKGTCLRESVPEDPGLFGAWLEEDNRRKEVLRTDVKEQAENLMIVDLIRHDLNWIAKDGLVRVPGLMQIESFRTVHQMVTTVEALVDQRISHIAALAHCFPPGSMTGAPKLRTTQIIAALERHPRGAYSGCLGYFSACGRYSDWNVIIRTAVVHSHGSAISVGAGGALTILSDPNMEWAEVKTKLWSAVPGIKRYIG